MDRRPTLISIDHRGQRWSGDYTVDGRVVTVGGAYGSREARITGRKANEAEEKARAVLRDLVDEWCEERAK